MTLKKQESNNDTLCIGIYMLPNISIINSQPFSLNKTMKQQIVWAACNVWIAHGLQLDRNSEKKRNSKVSLSLTNLSFYASN